MFSHLVQRTAKPFFTNSITSTTRSAFSTTIPSRSTIIPFQKPFSNTSHTHPKSRSFSTSTTPTQPVPEPIQPQQPTTSAQTPTTTIEPEIKTPTWKNPLVFTLDTVVAGVLTYGAFQAYNFVFSQPPIIDVMFEQAQQSPFLIENLGTPMKRDMIWWGSIDDYQARVNFGISGPKSAGQIEGKAFRLKDDHWELVYLYGALPEFENRLTDLLPVDEDLTNTMPYIPDPNDPSAAHALSGAPSLPFTSANQEGDQNAEPVLLPNPAYAQHYVPFQKGEDHQQWVPEKVSVDDEDDDGFAARVKRKRDASQEAEITAEITRQHINELNESKEIAAQQVV